MCSALLAAGCSDSPTGSSGEPGVAESKSYSEPAPTEVAYGSTGVITAETGTVEYVISKPEVVTYHDAEYDATSKTATKQGAPFKPVVRVRLDIKGVSGEVPTGSQIQLVYEASDGTLAGETLPLGTFEKTDPISNHPTTVSAGQKVGGELYFDSSDGGGKVIASSVGKRQVVWRP